MNFHIPRGGRGGQNPKCEKFHTFKIYFEGFPKGIHTKEDMLLPTLP